MFPRSVDLAIKRHALAEFPNECCGIVVDNEYVPMRNITNEDPTNNFRMDPVVWCDYPHLQAIIHSHCDRRALNRDYNKPGIGIDCPTRNDMISQQQTAVPWGICVTDGNNANDPFYFGDHLLSMPLKERVFRHGVTDCYALLRAYYYQTYGIKLNEYPRDDGWWDHDQDMLEENFYKEGFRILEQDEKPNPGDVILAMVGSGVANHCGVYIGNGQVLHHLYNRLSRADPVPPYRKFIRHWLRLDRC